MTSKDVSRAIGGSETSHLRPEKTRATYEQIARALVPLRYWQRRAGMEWAVDVLLAADLSVRDYDFGIELVDILVHGTAERRRHVLARLLGSTTQQTVTRP